MRIYTPTTEPKYLIYLMFLNVICNKDKSKKTTSCLARVEHTS